MSFFFLAHPVYSIGPAYKVLLELYNFNDYLCLLSCLRGAGTFMRFSMNPSF